MVRLIMIIIKKKKKTNKQTMTDLEILHTHRVLVEDSKEDEKCRISKDPNHQLIIINDI